MSENICWGRHLDRNGNELPCQCVMQPNGVLHNYAVSGQTEWRANAPFTAVAFSEDEDPDERGEDR